MSYEESCAHKLSLRKKTARFMSTYNKKSEFLWEKNSTGRLNKARTDYLKRRFSYSGARLWNNLPEEVRTVNSLVGLLNSTPTR